MYDVGCRMSAHSIVFSVICTLMILLDLDKAALWFEKAASKNGYYLAATIHESGTSKHAPNPDRAYALYRKSAVSGHQPAFVPLATIALNSHNNETDAVLWLSRAARSGNTEAKKMLSSLKSRKHTDL